MADNSRLNLDLLRRMRPGNETTGLKSGPVMTRRSFLGYSGATAAAGSLAALPNKGFSVFWVGEALHVAATEQRSWIIDPKAFGSAARVRVERVPDGFNITLRNGVFPGTALVADFDSLLSEEHGVWKFALHIRSGISVEGDLLDWLYGRTAASGLWSEGGFRVFPGFWIRQDAPTEVSFYPDWRFEFRGSSVAKLQGLAGDVPVDSWGVAINGKDQLASGPSGHRTQISMQRGNERWPIDLSRTSKTGWSIQTDGETFDELRVEAMHQEGAVLRTALLTQTKGSAGTLHFMPGGGLIDQHQEPFRVALSAPRLAFNLETGPVTHTALVAEVCENAHWAHSDGMSMLLAGDPESPLFELFESTDPCDAACSGVPKVAPSVLELHIETEADVNMKVKFNGKRPSHWNFATAIQPFERLAGMLHLDFWEHHLTFDLTCDDRLHVLRYRDQLNLTFAFQNLQLHYGGFDPKIKHRRQRGETTRKNVPYLCCAPTGGDPLITVLFPPQHIIEHAFYRMDKDIDLEVTVGKAEKTPAIPGGSGATASINASDLDPDYPPAVPAPDGNDKFPAAGIPADSRMSGPSQLVFKVPEKAHIPFSLDRLLDWKSWGLQVADVARTDANDKSVIRKPGLYPSPIPGSTPKPILNLVTAIELPYRLFLSPSETATWEHAEAPVDYGTNIFELWHSRLGLPNAGETPASPASGTARAIWSDAYVDGLTTPLPPHDPHNSSPQFGYRASLDERDRCEIVHLTSNYKLIEASTDQVPGVTPQPAARPLQIDRLMLTPHGGYLKSLGTWDPPRISDAAHPGFTNILTVERWQHNATLGRDHAVRVDYKGFLMPFGFRASLVKVTERYIDLPPDSVDNAIAYLHQRMYIVVKNPDIYPPILGQKYAGREIAFDHIQLLTLQTPTLFPPETQTLPASQKQNQSLFWPSIDGVEPFQFNIRFWNGKNYSDSMASLAFAGADVVQDPVGAPGAVKFYNAGDPTAPASTQYSTNPRTASSFNDQKVAFARSAKAGDTSYDVSLIHWRADSLDQTAGVSALKLYQNDVPLFFPAIDNALISSSAVKRVAASGTTGSSQSATDPEQITRVGFYPQYLESAFDPKVNRGEVFLNVIAHPVPLQFGKNKAVAQSGGLASADTLVVGFARPHGPVGGLNSDVDAALNAKATLAIARQKRIRFHAAATVSTSSSLDVHAQGQFNAASFFGGMASAKILGGIKLSDIISPFLAGVASNLDEAPQMLEEALFDLAAGTEDAIVKIIDGIQNATLPGSKPGAINPLARALATQAQAVDDSYALIGSGAGIPLVLQASFLSAVIQYGDALKAQLENPAALGEQAMLQILTDKLGTVIGNFELQLTATATAYLAALQAQLDAVLNQALTALGGVAATAMIQVGNALTTAADALDVKVPFRELVPELLAYGDLVPVVQDLISRTKKMRGATLGTQDISQFLQNVNPILDDLLTIFERLGFLDAASAGSVAGAVRDVEIEAMNKFAVVYDLTQDKAIDVALEALNDACLTLAAALPSADAMQVLQNLRQIQRVVKRLQQIPSGIAPVAAGSDIDQRQWALSQLQRKVQLQVLDSLMALRTAADQVIDQVTDQVALAAAKDLLAACSLLPGLLTVVDAIAKPSGTTTFLDLTNLPPELFDSLQTRLDDLDPRITSLQKQVATATTPTSKLAAQTQLFKAAINYQVPFAAVHGLRLSLSGTFSLPDTVTTPLSALAGSVGALRQQVATLIDILKGALTILAAAGETITDKLKAVAANPGAQVLSELIAVATNTFDAYDKLKKPLGRSQVLYQSHQLIAAFTALIQKIQQQVLSATGDVALLQQAAKQLPQLLAMIPQAAKIKLSYDWHPKLKNFDPVFMLLHDADFVIQAESIIPVTSPGEATYTIRASLSNFSINLIGAPSFVIIDIKSLTFTSVNGSSPNCDMKILGVGFGQDMSFVQELASLLDPKEGPYLEIRPDRVLAGFRFQVPKIQVGAFSMIQLRLEVSIELPFDGSPVRCIFGISDEENPFLLSAGIYGGGGFLALRLGLDGVESLEGALEFGLVASITIGPLSGTGYVVAGIYFRIAGDDSRVCGFVHAHGHMDILGLISMTIDLQVSVCYLKGGRVHGEAEFKVDVEIFFFSASYTFNAAYDFAGSPSSSGSQSSPARRRMGVAGAKALAATCDMDPIPIPFCGVVADRWAEYFDCFAD